MRMNNKVNFDCPIERKQFLGEFIEALLDNRFEYPRNGRQILLSKKRQLPAMNPEKTQKLHEYLRDSFMDYYLSKAIPTACPIDPKKKGLTRKTRFSPIVKVEM